MMSYVVPLIILASAPRVECSSVPRGDNVIGMMIRHLTGDLQRSNRRDYMFDSSRTEEEEFDFDLMPKSQLPWWAGKEHLEGGKPTVIARRRINRGGQNPFPLSGNQPNHSSNLRGSGSMRRRLASSSSYSYLGTDPETLAAYYGFDLQGEAQSASGSGSNDGDWTADDDGQYDDDQCHMWGLSFIGISFSIIDNNGSVGCDEDNEGSGTYSNPNTQGVNDNQFRMNCIIDRQVSQVVAFIFFDFLQSFLLLLLTRRIRIHCRPCRRCN